MVNTKLNFHKKLERINSVKSINYITAKKIQLQDKPKNDIEFLFQLYFHFYNLDIQIN